VTIGQSKAIERYVAKRLGFYGTSIEEEAHIDAICEHIRDIKDMYLAFKSSLKRFEESQSSRVMFLSRHLPLWLLKLEKVVAADGFCVGSRLSIADLNLFVFLTEYFDHVDIALESIKNSPKIQAILHSVLLRVQPWLEDRPLSLI
jgi:glutathione S-transferase